MAAAVLSPPVPLAPRPETAHELSWLRKIANLPAAARMRTVIRQSRRHGLWIFAWSIVGWVGTALAPALADKPLLLMMLSPRALFVALASNSVPLIPFVILGTLRLSVTDASYYIIGRRFPDGTDHAPTTTMARPSRWRIRLRRLATEGDRLCRFFCSRPRLAGTFLFFRPNGKYLGVAGAYGVQPFVAGLSAVSGTAVFLAAVHIGVSTIF